MAVAVKKETESAVGLPALGFAGASLFGTVYVLAAFLVVYHAIPYFWETQVQMAGMLGTVLRLGLMAAATAGLIYLWSRLIPTQPGVRAGMTAGILLLLLGFALVYLLARIVEAIFPTGILVGEIVAVLGAGLWLLMTLKTFQRERFHNRMLGWEDNGWFTAKPFKRGQGLKARRGTMLGILIIVGTGLYVYTSRRTLSWATLNLDYWGPHWFAWRIPFTEEAYIPLVQGPSFTLPIFLGALALWLAYRLVNYPKFADFLIATEAEMNKVSFSSRKKLTQDTIVVLVTVVFMSAFLLFVDILWSFLLTRIGVIQH